MMATSSSSASSCSSCQADDGMAECTCAGSSSSISAWDQRKSLQPAPFKGKMKRLVAGLNVGDPRVDALPLSAVCCHGDKPRLIGLEDAPAWVDWDQVRRGQEVFMQHSGQAFVALSLALLQGFSIARFAEVLHHNGYAQSGETAFERYRDTGFAIVDWMRHPLDEPGSKARDQLQNVRAMHSFARRKSMKIFDAANGEGIALSQYDMAEVQMAFAAVTPSVLETEMGVALTRSQKRDLCAAWRIVGFYLGIQDEYNACNSLEDMEELFEEWIQYVPLRFTSCRSCTFDLQRTALEGFGRFSGTGIEVFSGMLHATCSSRNWEVEYLERPCKPGMKAFGMHAIRGMGSPIFNRLMSLNLLFMRDNWGKNPAQQRRIMQYLAVVSRANDLVLWPIVGYATLLAHFTLAKWYRKLAAMWLVLTLLSTNAGWISRRTLLRPFRALLLAGKRSIKA